MLVWLVGFVSVYGQKIRVSVNRKPYLNLPETYF